MKIYKITEASDYLGVAINTLKALANKGGFMKNHEAKSKPTYRWRVRGIGDSGAWYEVGTYYGMSAKDAIERCKKVNAKDPYIFRGLKLIADRIGM